jgi:hypothetical protein
VPAHQELLPITQRAFQALPETVVERYFRGDSACHEQSLMEWLRDEQRAGGPQGRIGFAVSARMNPVLHAEMVATPEWRWQPYSEDSTVVKECCEVDYITFLKKLRIRIASRCAMWPFEYARSRGRCLPMAAR